jgi:flagellar biosynthesis protein FliR
MDFSVVARFALLLVRPGMVISVAPGIGGPSMPARVEVALTVLIALGSCPSVRCRSGAATLPLLVVIAREVCIGLSLALRCGC